MFPVLECVGANGGQGPIIMFGKCMPGIGLRPRESDVIGPGP